MPRGGGRHGEREGSDALDDLYRTYAPAVLGYLRGLGVPDAEDVSSEVFVAVVRSLERFEGSDDDLRRWLFTIAHRRAMDAFRQRGRNREESMDPVAMSDAPLPGSDVGEQVTLRLSALPAFQALDGLTDDQRAVVLLRLVADLSVAETATVLGKQPGAVKTLQRRAVASLRRALSLEAVS